MDKIGGLSSIRKMGSIPELGEAKIRAPAHFRVARRRDVPGRRVDILEEAAMPTTIGTLPERIIWQWLEEQGYLYQAQQAELGGRDVIGGAVIDFLVYDMGARLTVIRVMGTYWHGPQFPGRQAVDNEQMRRLIELGYTVLDLWEDDIYEAVRWRRLTAYIMGELSKAV